MVTVYVALGANIGDPARTILAAFDALAGLPDCRLVATSPRYLSAPVGLAGQPDFVNAVARLETSLSAPDLLAALFAVEQQFGRRRGERNGPRTLDLDLLLYGQQAIDTAQLTVPHPRLHLRAFVLLPLADLDPTLEIPGRGSLAAWLPAVATQGIRRLDP